MTNKLPEIGKKYKRIKPITNSLGIGKEITILSTNFPSNSDLNIAWVCNTGKGEGRMNLKEFQENYEELPNQDHIADVGKKVDDRVQEALEELTETINEVKSRFQRNSCDLENVIEKAQKLVNAIEEQQKPKDKEVLNVDEFLNKLDELQSEVIKMRKK